MWNQLVLILKSITLFRLIYEDAIRYGGKNIITTLKSKNKPYFIIDINDIRYFIAGEVARNNK